VYGDVAAIAAGALANCRARNLNIIRVRPCMTEENEFVATTHRSSNIRTCVGVYAMAASVSNSVWNWVLNRS